MSVQIIIQQHLDYIEDNLTSGISIEELCNFAGYSYEHYCRLFQHFIGNEWLNAVIDYHTKQGFGKEHNLSGFDGYISCLEERKKRKLYILKNLNLEYKILKGKPCIL